MKTCRLYVNPALSLSVYVAIAMDLMLLPLTLLQALLLYNLINTVVLVGYVINSLVQVKVCICM